MRRHLMFVVLFAVLFPSLAWAAVNCSKKPNGTPCDDGNACTANDVCQAGICSGTPAQNGTPCDDGNACTQTDTCRDGTCIGANPVTCTAPDQCHAEGTCNPKNGKCSQPKPLPNGTTCDDGNACTQTDTCQRGACVGANPVTCLALDQCHLAGTCDPISGCSNPAKPDGTPCDDANACTQTDTCQTGACLGANPVTCSPLDQCHLAGTCDATTGQCSNPPEADGTMCNDGNVCTQTDSCQNGACVGANPVTCSALDQCHDVGTCDPISGCSNPAKPDSTPCNDSNTCTQTDSCQNGACVGANLVTCSALDQCHDVGTCDPISGCSNPAKPDNTPCNDTNPCTLTDTCQSGVCIGSSPPGTAGSIVVFENLQVDPAGDPLLSLENLANQTIFASCFYANTSCNQNLDNFVVQLAAQSQMQWQAGMGSPGVVPPLPGDFNGELVCVETDSSGDPIPGNGLVGSAQYQGLCPIGATSISGFNTNNGDDTLCLGGGVTATCPSGAEYVSCPSGVDPTRIASCWSQSEFVFVCGSGAACTDGALCDDGNPNTVNDVCIGGVCVGSCPAGSTLCGSLCVDTNTDRNNCGACRIVCASGTACVGGTCQGGCPTGTTPCGGVCVNESTDPQNCGACGNPCTPPTTCTGGSCQTVCPAGTALCSGTCVNQNTDPNNCGACGAMCTAGKTCTGGTCVTNQVAGSCLPTSSLAVLTQGTAPGATVTAYVPMGSWSETGTGIIVVQLEPTGGPPTVVPTTLPVNSCSSNSATGLTVCTGNTNDVYVLQGTTLTTTLTAGGTGTQNFSGGSCISCGVATDAGTGLAWIAEGTSASTGQLQSLKPALPPLSSVFGLPLDLFGQMTSEDMSIDPVRHLILSALEAGQFQIIDTTTNAVFNAPTPFLDAPGGMPLDLDSTAEDCSTGIAVAPAEFSGPPSLIPPLILLADLSQATYTPGSPGTWVAPTNVQAFPEFSNMLAAGPSAIAVAPGSHLAGVTDEFGGAAFGVVQLPAASGVGTPSAPDYVAANMPNDPGNVPWSMGLDPHPMTAYTSPNTLKAMLVISNASRTYLALVDMQALLAAKLPGTHTVSVDLVASGIVTFVAE